MLTSFGGQGIISIVIGIKEQGMNNMKTLKKILAGAVAAMMLFSFASCKDNPAEGGSDIEETAAPTTSYVREVKTKIASLSGPLGVGIAKLAADRDYAYETTLYSDAAQISELIKNGSADIAVLPVNLAAKLYNETNGAVKILAVNTLGVFHILEKGDSIKSISDLRGKTVYAVGEGALPEYLLNAVLDKNGLGGGVNVKFAADYNEISALVSEGKADVVMLPEPYASTVQGMRYALDLSDEWGKAYETPFTQGVIVARAEYIENNPEYIETFLMQNEVSVNFLVEVPQMNGTLAYESGYFESVELGDASIPRCNPSFIRGEKMKTAVSAVFDMLYDADPELIGGKIPDNGIYY